MAEIRPNIVKRKLQFGERVKVIAGYMDPDLVEVFGNLGFDVDMEATDQFVEEYDGASGMAVSVGTSIVGNAFNGELGISANEDALV